MNRYLLWSACIWLNACIMQAAEFDVAVIDLAHVFEQYTTHQQRVREMESWYGQHLLDRRREREASRERQLKLISDQLQQHAPGSAEYQRLTKELVDRVDLNCGIPLPVRDLQAQQREAAIYLASHREVQSAIDQYAREHNIMLVIRQQQLPDEEPGLADAYRRANRSVVFGDQAVDITAAILNRLNAAGDSSQQRSP